MEGLIWLAGAALVVVVGLSVFTVLRLREAEQWLRSAQEQAPAKKMANLEAFLSTIRKEFNTLLEENDQKHDRWMREQASLRTYVYRRLGKEIKDDGDAGSPADVPDRITKEEAQRLAAANGSDGPAAEDRNTVRRKIKAAYFAARGGTP